jgi:hypothetical protein
LVKRDGLSVLLVAVGLFPIVILPQIGGYSQFKTTQDAGSYIQMAEGHPDNVLLHHARRMFHPWVVGRLRWIAGTDIAFLIVGVLSLFLFLWIVLTHLHRDRRYGLPASFGFVFLPYLFILFHDLYLLSSDALFPGPVRRLLASGPEKKYLAGVILLLPMSLTRDEAVIIAAAFLAVIPLKKQKDLAKTPPFHSDGPWGKDRPKGSMSLVMKNTGDGGSAVRTGPLADPVHLHSESPALDERPEAMRAIRDIAFP